MILLDTRASVILDRIPYAIQCVHGDNSLARNDPRGGLRRTGCQSGVKRVAASKKVAVRNINMGLSRQNGRIGILSSAEALF
jgi:hypothetical protein